MEDGRMTQETDIAVLAAEALAKATTPEKVREIVDREIGKTVEEAIKRSVQSYSPFGKALEEKLKDAMGIEKLNLPSYSQMMTDLVQRLVQKHVADHVGARLEEDIKDILNIAPKSIKLSEIADAMRERKEGDGHYGHVITVHVDDDDRHADSDFWGPSWTIYLDEDRHEKNPKDADIKIRVSHGIRDKEGPPSHKLTTGTIWMIEDRGRKVTAAKSEGWNGTFRRPDKVYGLAERLLAYYAAGTVIEIDEDAVVTSVGDY
jgi:hypothetical protein